MEWSLRYHGNVQDSCSIAQPPFKYLSRALELMYLTSGNEKHVMWIMLGEGSDKLPKVVLETFVSAAKDIYDGKAFLDYS